MNRSPRHRKSGIPISASSGNSRVLTLFFTAKPFQGANGLAQERAISSWLAIDPKPEILLMGRGPGYEQVVEKFGLRHLPDIATNQRGLPLMDAMFEAAQLTAANGLLCYVNADILFFGDINNAVRTLASEKRKFLAIGPCWTIDYRAGKLPDPGTPGWEETLRSQAIPPTRNGRNLVGIDYFLFRAGTLTDLPPFMHSGAGWSLGWDNRIIHFARSRGHIVIDTTTAITAMHQEHGAGEAEQAGWRLQWVSPEELFSIADATHLLGAGRVRRSTRVHNLWRLFYTMFVLHKSLRFLKPVVDTLLKLTHPVRKRCGVTVAAMAGIRRNKQA